MAYERWSQTTKQNETWSSATKQNETWTADTQQNEVWGIETSHYFMLRNGNDRFLFRDAASGLLLGH